MQSASRVQLQMTQLLLCCRCMVAWFGAGLDTWQSTMLFNAVQISWYSCMASAASAGRATKTRAGLMPQSTVGALAPCVSYCMGCLLWVWGAGTLAMHSHIMLVSSAVDVLRPGQRVMHQCTTCSA
jgi:hypothetical protein